MKKVYIRQTAGLGDIFFLQKAANYLLESGYNEIIWPIINHYEYLKEYNTNDKIKFILENELSDDVKKVYKEDKIILDENYLYIPFDKSAQIKRDFIDFLGVKYSLIKGLDYSNWQKFCNFKRFEDREEKCKQYFNISDGDEFIFVNSIFASPPNHHKRDMVINTNVKIVENKHEYMSLFNIFDYSWILENAKEIHTVETSICYLVEILNTNGKLNLYSRKIGYNNQYANFDYVKNIYKKDWKYIL
jgi:hypothetical protein